MNAIGLLASDTYYIILVYLGLIILISVLLPKLLESHKLTSPIVYLVLAIIVFSFFSESPLPHLSDDPIIGKRITELGIIISLTAAGLKLNSPFSWETWKYPIRLLLITMPLTVVAVMLFGWQYLGFAPATALLLGAAIAPTDSVLAPNVQSSSPHKDKAGSSRLILTGESGFNDGLAFPFINMAIAMALIGTHPSLWINDWLMIDILYRISVGAFIGLVSGWFLSKFIFSSPKPKSHSSALLALTLTLFPYGLAELAFSYGFIAVFVAACVFRYEETKNEFIVPLNDFSEDIEKPLLAILFTLLGVYISHGFIHDFELYMIPTALIILLVVRPVTGLIALSGTNINLSRKFFISFYGIRGIGSIFYLLYAFSHASFEQSNEALALVTTVIICSIFIHGLSAKYLVERCEPGCT
ncbi:cation:proton antiporter [Methanosalsum natronophilum]|uniref:cation:proton antiporter n=1 Tax=Methanosalsum natronophilum TaxID=768733 RepID=UPI00216705DE|nr:cation:proton antiporter [Methanosalsum natronophilum]MCS3923641.1 NhaP-type Na+/H+ or K+/H+ antiporter [Methanosalsum natronophilum]